MGCTTAGYKTFLVVSNIALLFLGLTIMSLGVKMKSTLEVFRLDSIPLLINSVKAVVATGFFITVTGVAGFSGACYEVLWMLLVHLGGLGLIVVMEFSLGVTLMVLKNTAEAALMQTDCGETCLGIMDYVVKKMATGTAGTMLTVIIMEALMIYSAIKLYFYMRDAPKLPPAAAMAGPTVVVQNVQMTNVAAPAPPQPQYVMTAPPPQPQYMPQQQQPQQCMPQQPQQCMPQQQPYVAPPPYSQVQQPQSEPQPYVQATVQPPSQPQVEPQPCIQASVHLNATTGEPPLRTSTLTRKPSKGEA